MNLGEWRLSSYRFTLSGCRVRDGAVERFEVTASAFAAKTALAGTGADAMRVAS